jgi:hypothetical protein
MKRSFGWMAVAVVGSAGLIALSVAPARAFLASGCGLGSMVIEKNHKVGQVASATLNGSFGTQTFGISTGTSNCTTDGTLMGEKEQQAFAEANLQNLEHDMASGGGEYLAAFSTLLGCEPSLQPAVASFAQQNYAKTFPSDDTSASEALDSFKTQLASNDTFAQGCTHL